MHRAATASAGVAVAATDLNRQAGAIIAAALALPGVCAFADASPADGVISLKYLQYQDEQPGLKRVHVSAPAVYVLAPIGQRWSLEGSAVSDSVSGASPRYHTAISGASRMHDERHAGDLKLTRHEDRSTYAVGVAGSSEHDYQSRALSFDASFASDDNNRTWNTGVGFSSDRISSRNDLSLHEHKGTAQFLLGLTQVLTADDIVQVDLTWQRGRGFFSDPYKALDVRPRKRDEGILLGRWNHYVDSLGSTLRTSYRYYRDSFGIRAHALDAEWVQPVGRAWTVTPSVRLYSQSAASFYYDPIYDSAVGAPYPIGYFTNPPTYLSPDQRLSAFGAITGGLKVAWQITHDWSTDIKAERYEQRADWRVGGNGSPGLAPFSAMVYQLGLNSRF